MRTIAVTGRTGVGKSRLLASLLKPNRMTLVDPLATPARGWKEPDPEVCRGVAIDHTYHLDGAKEVVAEVVSWCEHHNVPLWIVGATLDDIQANGVELPEDTFQLNLLYPDEEENSERIDRGVNVTLKTGLQWVKQFVPAP